MKKIIVTLIVALSITASGYSQDIIHFFKNVPDSSIMNISKYDREKIVKQSIDNRSDDDAHKDLSIDGVNYAFNVVDIRNGYLSLTGFFEGRFQMCYWNLKNGNKFIAVYCEDHHTLGAVVGSLCFYEYNGKSYKPIDRDKVIPNIFDDFLGDNKEAKLKKMGEDETYASVIYQLPRKGKNIIAKWGNMDGQEAYREYGIGDRMVLVWNNGTFTKGKIYWENR